MHFAFLITSFEIFLLLKSFMIETCSFKVNLDFITLFEMMKRIKEIKLEHQNVDNKKDKINLHILNLLRNFKRDDKIP